MQFAFSEEQEQFRDMVRRFLADTSPTTEVRRLMETADGFDPGIWERLSSELALPGLGIPEQFGGGGFGMVELCIAMEEMGRALLCAPFFSSAVLSAKAIELIADDAQRSRLLPQLASGQLRAALAVTEDDGSPDLAAVKLTARRSGGDFVLDGDKKFVLDGCSASLLLVVGREPGTEGVDGLSLYAVTADAPGLIRRPLQTLDPTRKQAALCFRGTPATLLGTPGAAGPGLRRVLDLAAIALANEMMGGAQRLLEDTVAFTKLRMQFGRPIASFQAIKHRATDMLLTVELAKSGAYYAAAAGDEDDPELPALASLAKAAASEAYLQTAIDAIQLHGGIGFTWDQDTHLWFKRAKSSEVLLGDPTWHRERMMQETLDQQARSKQRPRQEQSA